MVNIIVTQVPMIYVVILRFIGQMLTSALIDYMYSSVLFRGKVTGIILFLIGLAFNARIDNKHAENIKADDTLFDFKKSEKEAFKNTMLEFGIEYDESYHLKIYHDINNAIWKKFEDGLITQENLKIERFKILSKQLNVGFNEVKLLFINRTL